MSDRIHVREARLEDESEIRVLFEILDTEKNLGFDPNELKNQLDPSQMMTPRDDDTYSPLHDGEEESDVAPPPKPTEEDPAKT